ncbi:hypothetical protein B0H14DRAFT_2923931 [Mycena olivaceomarginata]|nr:hypothetical protein B0H14DRAFT_2923931 [Mycena olivaceomarginata]
MNVALAPRPPKLPFFTPSKANIPSVTGKTGILPTWCREDGNDVDLTTPDHHFIRSQTKYIPSSSRVSQGGRYKIMFFDGSDPEIDVDEDWAELTSPGGETTRHNIRECNAKRHVAERMKVFGDFVSMFDDTDEG